MFRTVSCVQQALANAAAAIMIVVLLSGLALSQTANSNITRSWPVVGQTNAASTTTATTTTTTKPAIVRDIDNPVRQTLMNFWTTFTGLGDGSGGCGTGWSTPDGSRIVIELISIKFVSPVPLNGPYVAIGTNKTGTLGYNEPSSAAIEIASQPQGLHYQTSTSNSYHYVAVQPVHLQVLKDDWLCENIYVGPDFVNGSLHISYFGYVTTP